MRHATKIGCDTRGMLRHALAVLVGAAAAAVIVACSAPADAGQPAKTVSKSVPTSVVASPTPSASAATIDGCRSLATHERLNAFWRKIANGETVTGYDATLAAMAVMGLGKWDSDPDLDPSVADAMTTAVRNMMSMNQGLAAGAPFDVARFKGILTPVVTACQDAGVDMAVP